jgi:exonuclease III
VSPISKPIKTSELGIVSININSIRGSILGYIKSDIMAIQETKSDNELELYRQIL